MTREVEVSRVTRDEGSVVVFVGLDINNSVEVEFAVDHRMAQPLAEHLVYHPEEPPVVEIEEWQVLSMGQPLR